MQYAEGKIGRIFVLRLEEGERLNDTLEAFARNHAIPRALAFYLGGAADGSRVVVGPDEERHDGIIPLIHTLVGSQEVLAVGTLFPTKLASRCSTCMRRQGGKAGQRWAAPGPEWMSGWWAKSSCWKSWGPGQNARKMDQPGSSCSRCHKKPVRVGSRRSRQAGEMLAGARSGAHNPRLR
jgi:hypothetical protein